MALTHITRCAICNHPFTGPAFPKLQGVDASAATEIGAQLNHAQKYLTTLLQHLMDPQGHQPKTKRIAGQLQQIPCQCPTCQAHHKALAMSQAYGNELYGMCWLSFFASEDPELGAERDRRRWEIHQGTRRAIIGDDTIQRKAGELIEAWRQQASGNGIEIPPSFIERARADIANLLTSMRDALMESGRYQIDDDRPGIWPGIPIDLPPNLR